MTETEFEYKASINSKDTLAAIQHINQRIRETAEHAEILPIEIFGKYDNQVAGAIKRKDVIMHQLQEISEQFDASEDKPALTFRAFELYKELVNIQSSLENILNG